MPRYFIEVAYKGTHYAGFQIQDTSNTIQGEINKSLAVLFKKEISTTTSSRTDAGVHALQNYLHLDINERITSKDLYHLNAILPKDIVIKNILAVGENAHARFDALSRKYEYHIYQNKNPFLDEVAYPYFYKLDKEILVQSAILLIGSHNFKAFAKKHSDVLNYNCTVLKSEWQFNHQNLIYTVEGNRFLRGMVRSLVATMLHTARGKLNMEEFKALIHSENKQAFFDVPAQGLHLVAVTYSNNMFQSH